MVRAGVQTTRRVGQVIVPGTGAGGDGARTADPGGLRLGREAEGRLASSAAIVTATTLAVRHRRQRTSTDVNG
jgi:hypothetical protein